MAPSLSTTHVLFCLPLDEAHCHLINRLRLLQIEHDQFITIAKDSAKTMLPLTIFSLSALVWHSYAAPIYPDLLRRAGEEPFVLPIPTDGPGPTFDATAARSATSAQIRSAASPDICFDVSDFHAGDLRFNLVPIALKPCDATVDGQKFDLITKGAHNNVEDGSRTLIVSSQQFTCVDRRSNKSDRTRPGLFACGGRAAGDGETTADQQYFFNPTTSPSSGIGFPLVRGAVNNGVGPGNQCLSLNSDGFLSNTPCTPPLFTPEQTWIVGADASTVPPPMISSISASATSDTQSQATGTSTQPQSVTSATTATATSASTAVPEKFELPAPNDGPGPTFDATATRAATGAQIRSAASPDLCFDVSDFRAGDFRFNLVPLALKKCDGSVDGQKFDLVTKGKHNNAADGSRTLLVSTQQFTCVDKRSNINDRTRPGLFACGGRAAGDGETTADQQYIFNSSASLAGGIGFPLARDAVNGGAGPGNHCLTLNTDGFVSNNPCSPPFLTPEQTWIIGGSSEAPSSPSEPATPTSPDTSTTTAPAATIATVTSLSTAAGKIISTAAPTSTLTAGAPENFVLPVPAEGPGPLFDATATRAATSAQIKSAASPDICFDVSDFRAGDFRFNLVPLALKKCDASIDGQKFDLITKDTGGRAVGDGETQSDEQFFLNSTASFSGGIGFPYVTNAVNGGVGPGNQCLTLNADDFVSNTPCAPPVFTPEQTWIVG
ncbi:hypothetical protein DXG01_012507 [Tephrocybe rancida]|nr:hypothetical protein DXG01_012507 [Tephrocybe rancida]